MLSSAGCVNTSTNPQSAQNSQQTCVLLSCSPSPRGNPGPLTASGSIFPPGPKFQSFVLGISITPSMTACATCTPFGPISRARLCAIARRANFIVAKAAKLAEPFTEAVAPVKISVGGWDWSVELRSKGRAAWEKLKAPLLLDWQHRQPRPLRHLRHQIFATHTLPA